jgi:hypothetical protein
MPAASSCSLPRCAQCRLQTCLFLLLEFFMSGSAAAVMEHPNTVTHRAQCVYCSPQDAPAVVYRKGPCSPQNKVG